MDEADKNFVCQCDAPPRYCRGCYKAVQKSEDKWRKVAVSQRRMRKQLKTQLADVQKELAFYKPCKNCGHSIAVHHGDKGCYPVDEPCACKKPIPDFTNKKMCNAIVRMGEMYFPLKKEIEELRKQLTSYKRAGKDYLKLLEECEQLNKQLAEAKEAYNSGWRDGFAHQYKQTQILAGVLNKKKWELEKQLADMRTAVLNSQAELTKAKKELENEKKRLIWYMNTKNRGYDFGGCTFNCGIDGRCSGHQKEYEVKAQARQQKAKEIFDDVEKLLSTWSEWNKFQKLKKKHTEGE